MLIAASNADTTTAGNFPAPPARNRKLKKRGCCMIISEQVLIVIDVASQRISRHNHDTSLGIY
jgi:hypothetical protein